MSGGLAFSLLDHITDVIFFFFFCTTSFVYNLLIKIYDWFKLSDGVKKGKLNAREIINSNPKEKD